MSRSLLLSAVLLSASVASAQPSAGPDPSDALLADIEAIEGLSELGDDAIELRLSDVIRRALASNLGLRVKVRELEAAERREVAAIGRWMPYLTAGWSYGPWRRESYIDRLKTWERSSGYTAGYSLGAGVSLFTGTTFDMSWSQSAFEQEQTFDPEITFIAENNESTRRFANLRIALNQNLLRGISPEYHLTPLRQAQLGSDAADVEHDRTAASVVQRAMSAYWDLTAALRRVEISRVDRRLAEQQRAVTEARIAAGEVAAIERYRIDEEVATRSADVIEARREAAEAEQTLVLLMGLGARDPLRQGRLRPLDGIEVDLPYRSRESSMPTALQDNPDLRAARLSLEGKALDLRRSRHELLPTLDLDAAVTLNGSDSAANASAAAAEVGEGAYPELSLGMNLRIPLPDLASIEGARAAALDHEAAQLGLEDAERQVIAGVETALRSIEAFEEQVGVAQQRVRFAAANAEAAEATYAAGRNTLQEVLEAQARLKDARRAELTAQVAALKARVELEVLRGSLLDALGVEVE